MRAAPFMPPMILLGALLSRLDFLCACSGTLVPSAWLVWLRRLNAGFAGKLLEFTASGTDVELKIRGWAKFYTGETRYAAARAFINDTDVQATIRELGPSKRALKAIGHMQSLDSPCKRIRSGIPPTMDA